MQIPKLPTVKIEAKAEGKKKGELHAIVTVGPESAPLLSKRLGREVKVGEQIDLGAVAVSDPNPIKNWWGNFKAMVRHQKSPFRKPLK